MNIILASIFVLSSLAAPLAPTINQSPDPVIGNTIDCLPHKLDGFQLPAWVTNDTWYRPMPDHTTGDSVWYAPWMMEGTANFRGMSLDGFMGGIATNSVGDMGKTAWLKRDGMGWEGPYLFVDVSQRNHAYHHAVNVGTIFEVDFLTALRWGFVSKANNQKGYVVDNWLVTNVEMFIGLQVPETLGVPIDYKEWYIENAEFCDGQPLRRWVIEDWMIMSFEDYENELVIFEKENPVVVNPFTPVFMTSNINASAPLSNLSNLSCSQQFTNLQLEISDLEAEIEILRSRPRLTTVSMTWPFEMSITFQSLIQ